MQEKVFYDLTSPQKNIYMREEFYKDTSINNLSFNIYFENFLDEKIIVKVLNKIVEKNEGLRLRFEINGNNVMQYVEEYEHEDFQIKNYKNKELKEIEEEISQDSKIPFIFENRKLYKIVIYRLKDDATLIYVKLHHIISDAWATQIFYDQFIKYYKAYNGADVLNKKNQTLETPKQILDEEKPSYLNYIEAEKNYFISQKYEKDKEYWEEYVKDLPEAVAFKEYIIKKTSKSKRFSKELRISKAVNEYCNKNKISAFAFFVAVYAIYINKSQSKEDFTIGTPLLNRRNQKEKETFGVFISTVPLKIHIDQEIKIHKFIKQIATRLMGMLRHESYPYSEIQDYVYSRNKDNSNLFDTIISFQNIMADSRNVKGKVRTSWNYPGNQQTSLELHISDHNNTGKYTLSFDYNENFCNDEEIQLVFRRFNNIIKQIIDSEKSEITPKEIDLLDKKEENQVLKKFNTTTKYIPSKTLIELFEEQVRINGDKIALKYKDIEITYRELNERANVIANELLMQGVNSNIPVSIILERNIYTVIAMLGVLKAGAYYVTIDPAWPLDRINYIMNNISSKYIITQKKFKEKYNSEKIIIVEDINYNIETNIKKNDTKMSDYVYVIYTSGSTGKPKGTMMTNTNINNLLHSTHSRINQGEDDVWTLFHTYTFDFSAWEIYGCLTQGGKLVVVPKDVTTNPQEMLKLIIREKITILNQTPAYFYKVLDAHKLQDEKLTKLKMVILGGEAVSAEPLKYWKKQYPNIPIINGYGPTETTIFAIMGEISKKDIINDNILLGKPLDNYYITIVNKKGIPLGVGLEGEICITGNSVCDGYFNNKEMTEEKFINTDRGMLYKTGDVGYWESDGRIKYIGRNDNQVKIRGFRIELEEIEKELLKCEKVTKAVVFPIDNNNYTKSLVGFIEATEKHYTEKALETISKQLTSYMIPKLYQVKTMPINDNGKVDRRKLIESIKDAEEQRKIILPKNKIEKEIYDIIIKEKNIKYLSVQDDFFKDLGLDSLDVMRLATALSSYNVEIQKINNNPTIEKLALAISDKQKDIQYITKLYDISVTNLKFKYNLSSVFLTGGTGFLGTHILKELIFNNKVKNIYCLIRDKGNLNPEDRIKETLTRYFDNFENKWLDKVTVIPGDFEKEFLNLDNSKYKNLCDNITTIIHCGANVKHYGNYASFYKTNVIGTENIIKMAYDSNAKLAHISTISVGGFSKVENPYILTEKDINVNQEFKNHVYMITKYEAECKVLDAISKGWISAKIFRLGNIAPRLKDGVFQKNQYDNGFLARIQTIKDIKGIPKGLTEHKVDISPVDLCAKSIIALSSIRTSRTILHIYNRNTISIKRIFKKSNIKEISIEEAIKRIKKLDNPYNAHLLNDLMHTDYIETPISCRLTTREMIKAGFRWNRINDKYLETIFKLINQGRKE